MKFRIVTLFYLLNCLIYHSLGLGFPIQRALTLPTSTEESQGLLDVSYSDDTGNYNLNTGNMKNICLMMKSPMRVAPPSFPSIADCEEVNSTRCNFLLIE